MEPKDRTVRLVSNDIPGGPPDPGAPGESYRFSYHGEGGEFFVLLLKNILLTVLTLGIYAAWAKTARRKYIWEPHRGARAGLVYTGTGEEVFVAYLKVAAFYLVFLALPYVVKVTVSTGAGSAMQLVFALLLVLLIPFAVYWSRAYVLSRTQWRGIRFGLMEGTKEFSRTFIGGYFLTLLTIGFYFRQGGLRQT